MKSVENYVVRAVMALGAVAAQSQDADVRDDIRDDIASLLSLWKSEQPLALSAWAQHMASYLDRLGRQPDQSLDPILAAHTAVLRIRAALPNEKKAPPPPRVISPARPRVSNQTGAANHGRILAFVRQHPDVRTTALVQGLHGALSPRTIKRCLKELTVSGALVRTQVDGAVSYRVER